MPDDFDDETTFWREQRTGRRQPAPDLDAIRIQAGSVMCPYCRAAIDADCVNLSTGKPLKNLPCHTVRMTAARKASA